MTSAGEPTLSVEGLGRRFGARDVLSNVSLTLAAGERLLVRGPNGSGKTTLLRCVTGALAPTSGTVTVCGRAAGSMAARRLVGAIQAEQRDFAPSLTGSDAVWFAARLRLEDKRAARRESEALIEELELAEIAERRLDGCSTGMVQQVAFAETLVGAPRLLVLDEPTGSLDAAAAARLWAALDRRPELAVLMASHRDEDASRCSAVCELEPA